MKLTIKNSQGKEAGSFDLSFEPVESGKGNQAVHDVVVAYMAAQRSGTASTKTMGDVAGSGKKPWRQKGTGRARAGSFASPLWKGGGVVFGPHPRDYTKKVSKKTKSLAFRKAFSARLIAGDVIVVDELVFDTPKTKAFVAGLRKLTDGVVTTLVVTDAMEKNLKLASRNVEGIQVTPADSVNVYELLRYDKIVASKAALDKLNARLGE